MELDKELEKILTDIPLCSKCVLANIACCILTITDCRILKLKALFSAWAKANGYVKKPNIAKSERVQGTSFIVQPEDIEKVKP